MSTEPVGSLAEEAAKLVAVMQGWASEHAGHAGPEAETRRAPGANEPGHPVGADIPDDTSPGAAPGSAHAAHSYDSAECRWCPLCQTARLAKAASPEVREHLTSAALSLALAFKGLMDGLDTPSDRSDPVEKIDLDLDSPED